MGPNQESIFLQCLEEKASKRPGALNARNSTVWHVMVYSHLDIHSFLYIGYIPAMVKYFAVNNPSTFAFIANIFQ